MGTILVMTDEGINNLLEAVSDIPSFGNDKEDYSQLVPTTLDPVTPDRIAPLRNDIVKINYRIIKDLGCNQYLIDMNTTHFCQKCKLSSFTAIMGKRGLYCRICGSFS
jgi:hypothetical protein